MSELEEIKQKIKQEPDYIKSKEFADWVDNNKSLTLNQISEILECLPKDFNIDLSLIFNVNKDNIIEDSITHIQMKRNVGYIAARDIFYDKYDKIKSILTAIAPTLKTITKDLVKEKDYIELIKSVIPDTYLQNVKDEDLESLILGYYHNDCRGYIVKTLTLKYLYETCYKYSNMFIDMYWQDKLHKDEK